MSKFEDHLWREFVREHGNALAQMSTPTAKRVWRGPRLVAGISLGLAGVGVAVALVLGATATSPAFAVISNHDGTVTISIERASGIVGANARLHQLGVRAKVMQQVAGGLPLHVHGRPARTRRGPRTHGAPARSRRVRSRTPTGRSIRARFRLAGPWRSPRPLRPGPTAATVAPAARCGGAAERRAPVPAVRLLRPGKQHGQRPAQRQHRQQRPQLILGWLTPRALPFLTPAEGRTRRVDR